MLPQCVHRSNTSLNWHVLDHPHNRSIYRISRRKRHSSENNLPCRKSFGSISIHPSSFQLFSASCAFRGTTLEWLVHLLELEQLLGSILMRLPTMGSPRSLPEVAPATTVSIGGRLVPGSGSSENRILFKMSFTTAPVNCFVVRFFIGWSPGRL